MAARWRAQGQAGHGVPRTTPCCWLSVQQNVALAVAQVESPNKRAVAERVDYYLSLVQMDHASQKMPTSWGDEAAGRHRPPCPLPKVLLMDRPFGALDTPGRAHLQDALSSDQAELGNTVIAITHDVDEAVLLSDRIVMMTRPQSEILTVDLHPRAQGQGSPWRMTPITTSCASRCCASLRSSAR